MLDCLIVGAGPAGLTSAMYLKRNNLDILVLEKNAPGGALLSTASIQNYPGYEDIDGSELATNMFMQAKKLGVKVKREEVLAIDKLDNHFSVKTNKGEYLASNVILALGLSHKKLGLAKEERFSGRGISWCAICDGYLYKDKEVCVVGGGNSSLEESLYLSKICSKVHLIHRRDEFRADKYFVDKVLNTDNIVLHLNSNVIDIVGEDNIEAVVIKNNDNQITEIKCSCLFEFIGFEAKTEFLKELDICNEQGFILVDNDFMTKHNGLYAIGDCIDKKVRQIANAVGDAATASSILSTRIK